MGLAQAAERTASEMKPLNVSNTLNALCKLEAAAAAVSPTGWAGLAQAAERTASEMKPQDVAKSLNALCKLDETGLLLTSTRCPVEMHLTATTSV